MKSMNSLKSFNHTMLFCLHQTKAFSNTHFLSKLFKHFSLILFITQVSTTFALSTHQFSKKSKQDGIYLEGGGTFFQNLVSGAVTTFTYHGAPIIPYGNNRHAKGPGLYLGAGYKWALSPQWAWSLGGRLS